MALEHTQDDPSSLQLASLDEDELAARRSLPAGTISEIAFSAVIESHRSWLDSEGCNGQRAIFDKLDLRRALSSRAIADSDALGEREAIMLDKAHLIAAELSERDLRGASFRAAQLNGASLSGCDLRSVNFTDANLNGADLSHANLSGASFAGADLRNANLHAVRGLRSLVLAGVDLCEVRGVPLTAFARRDTTGALLPKAVYESLEPLSEASRNARTVFQVMLAACLYCILSLSSVTDQRVIANTGRIELPILNIDIMPSWFFGGAPALLLLTFAYLLIFLRHVWEGAARLPARFPDGTTVGDRTSPWFLTSLIERYHGADSALGASSHYGMRRRAAIIQIQGILSLLLGFWTVPATIALLGFRYLTRQSIAITSLHVLLLGMSVFLALTFHVVMKDTLRDVPASERAAHARPWTVRAIALLVFLVLCPATIYVASTDSAREYFAPELPTAPPSATDRAAGGALVDNDAWESAKLDFSERSLVGARGERAYLKNANLEEANLSRAKLARAKLNNATLLHATLRGANLRRADLSGARLTGADLSAADLREVVGLTPEMLAEACGDPNTKLPPNMKLRSCAANTPPLPAPAAVSK